MEGPMDDAIESPQKPQDKARERLNEFVEQRYPGGLPPESRPDEPPAGEDEPDRESKKPRSKSNSKRSGR